MKVLHLVDEPNLAWAVPWLQLLQELKKEGVGNVLCCPPGGTLEALARKEGFPVRPAKAALPWCPPACLSIKRALLLEKPDLIHTRLSAAARVGGYWGRKLGLPVVATVDKYPKAKYYRDVDLLVGCSTAVTAHMRSQGFPQERLATLPNPVEVDRYARDPKVRARLRSETGVGEETTVILGLGRLIDWKGFDLLIEACAHLPLDLQDWVLWIVGDGPERKPLEALVASLPIASRVRFFGFAADVRPFLWGADLFVQPSTEPEGFSLALLEALASGLPVVATQIGGTVDVVQEGLCGWMVPKGDVEALAGAIAKALSLCRLPDFIDKAVERARDFEATKIASRYTALYRHVLEDFHKKGVPAR